MQCAFPVRVKVKEPSSRLKPLYPEGLLVPCGKCVLCLKAKRLEWSMRVLHELCSHDSSIFITLTYRDEFLPANGSLVKEDLQKFFKRLRKSLGDRKIRYFAAGEYGDKTARPHYHAIIFGMDLTDIDKQYIIDAWPFADWSVKAIRQYSFGLAEAASIQYVAQYIDKVGNDLNRKVMYEDTNRVVPFRLSSLGIGRDYCDNNVDQITDLGYITVFGRTISLPRYYINRLNLDVDREEAVKADMEAVEYHTGISDLTDDDAYRVLSAREYTAYNDRRNKSREQSALNERSRVMLRRSKL